MTGQPQGRAGDRKMYLFRETDLFSSMKTPTLNTFEIGMQRERMFVFFFMVSGLIKKFHDNFQGSGTWAAVLNIAKVTAKDVEKKYTLVAENELGLESYKVAISTSPAPPGKLLYGKQCRGMHQTSQLTIAFILASKVLLTFRGVNG